MKRYFIYTIMVVAAIFVGCAPEVIDETPEMVEVGDIEVTFSVDGEEVRSLNLSSVSHNITVDVSLNNDGIYWNAISNKDWCYIDNEIKHRGSGSFNIVINANESFDARETATIKFVAGEYEEKMLTVDHNGNVFVLDQVYSAATKSAGSFSTKVKTFDAGEAWHFECDSWITATKGAVTTANGETFTEVTIAWEDNVNASRYGEVKLVKDDKDYADGWINIWQYGTELNYDAEGNLLLAAEEPAPLEIRVPAQTVKDITMPSWVTYTIQENGDNTVSYMLQFAGNPSDANHIRTTELVLSLLSGAADIQLPVIKQEYYAMDGLLTGPGLALFAKTWNEGGDVSQWYVDGVPTIIDDVDLTEIKEWTPIGTEERPWTGEFNGNGKKLINFTSSKPLFGICDNATIKNVVIDESSVFEYVGQFSDDLYLATLATEIRNNTVVESCTNNGKVSLDAISNADNKSIFVAGLVAKVDATSKLTRCSNIGAISVPSSCTITGSETSCEIGGLVAHNLGIVEDGFNNGAIVAGAQALKSKVGGVVANNGEGAIVRNSQNAGAITFNTQKGAAGTYEAQVAGIIAFGRGEVYYNVNEGDITLKSNVEKLYVGGVAALLPIDNTKFESNLQGNASDILSEGEARYAYFGGLAGCVQLETLNIDYAKDGSNAAGTINVTDGVSDLTNAVLCMGGHFGLIEGDVTLNAPIWDGTIGSTFVDLDNYCPTKAGGIIAQVNGIANITGAVVSGSISTAHRWDTKASKQVNHTLGGIVGECNDAVTIKNSNNNAAITWDRAGSKQRVQYSSAAIGGIAGRILGGNALIENCNSNANLYNGGYNNGSYDTYAKPNCTGGIVGSFGLSADIISETLTVRNCTNQGKLRALRGYVAGIVGWAQNATIEDCNYTVGAFEQDTNPHAAGIIAGAYTSTNVKNCTAILDINCGTGGSCNARAAGIVAVSSGTTLVENCSYFGTITYNYNKDITSNEYYGGIVGYGDAQTKVTGCRYGGVVDGITISANNVLTYATGVDHHNGDKCDAVVESVEFWNGK